MNDVDELRLMFLASQDFSNGSVVRGGMLVTDNQTKPLEFRCTSPIRPTGLQRVLYGKLLDIHVLISLIGIPLVRSASERPSIILVRDKRFLELQDKVDIPVVWLGRNEEDTGSEEEPNGSPTNGSPTNGSPTNASPLIICQTGQFEPIVVRGAPDRPEETREVRELLGQVFAKNSLLEPFERIRNALEQVHKEKIEDKT